MSLVPALVLLVVFIFASGIYSGGETGIYSLSRVRVDLEAQQGHAAARRIRRLLTDQTGLLITLLIANNVVNQAATYAGQGNSNGLPPTLVIDVGASRSAAQD